jgi:tRNA threonylcarbamoyladenosine dehydratase
MLHAFSRSEMLLGADALNKLKESNILVVGIGGVGSFAVEGLARIGVGNLILVDDDDVCLTNINRQIHATRKTVGKSKVKIMKERVLDINPDANVTTFKELYNSESADRILQKACTYVVDAIDMVSAKVDLIRRCHERDIKIISCMGTGNKLDPTTLTVSDLSETYMCRLAKVMRKKLRKLDIEHLKVVYSPEETIKPDTTHGGCDSGCICPNKDRTCLDRHSIPGSVSFMPSVAGMIIASEVVKDIIGEEA